MPTLPTTGPAEPGTVRRVFGLEVALESLNVKPLAREQHARVSSDNRAARISRRAARADVRLVDMDNRNRVAEPPPLKRGGTPSLPTAGWRINRKERHDE